jgi:hypothetical protein
MNYNTLEKQKLQYKIKNGPKIESLVEYELQNGTIVAMFQGSRGSYPELDFIVKYVDLGKRMRTPSHTHWIVDLLVKAEFNKEMVGLLCERYVEIYDVVSPFNTTDERNNYRLQYVEDTMNLFQDLDNHGYLSLEFIATIIELFILCEKRSDDAFMFKSLLQLVVDFCHDKRDFYQVVGYSKRV